MLIEVIFGLIWGSGMVALEFLDKAIADWELSGVKSLWIFVLGGGVFLELLGILFGFLQLCWPSNG